VKIRIAAIFLSVALAGCGNGPTLTTQATTSSFTGAQVYLTKYCVTCHNDKKTSGGVSFMDYSTTMSSSGAVTPLAPLASQIYMQVYNNTMPPSDQAFPAGSQDRILMLQSLYNWISVGAPNN
jgi:uncharacterized membrane protein